MTFGGFSWRRFFGISAFKSRVSRKIGIPLTASGRRRKLGASIFGIFGAATGAVAVAAIAAATSKRNSTVETPSKAPTKTKSPTGVHFCVVKGVTHGNHAASQRLCSIGDAAKLVPEPNNEHDRNAIRVLLQGGQEIGYISARQAGGRHLVTNVDGNSLFDHSDWLGTVRARNSFQFPTQFETCGSLPFGDALTCTGGDQDTLHFTGKERDAESGLDHFDFRQYSSSIGRWMRPDEPFADQSATSPQSWNIYSYVRNNPLNSVDTDGLLTIIIAGTWSDAAFWNNDAGIAKEAQNYLGEKPYIVCCWGGNKPEDRTSAATQAARIVHNHTFAPGEKLTVLTSSYGGDAALEMSNSLFLNHKIDNLLTLGNPVRPEYTPNLKMIGRWFNFYSYGDGVQVLGSDFSCLADLTACMANGGLKYRTQDFALNYAVPTPGYGRLGAHRALWGDADVRAYWWNIFLNSQLPNGGSSNGGQGPKPAGRIPFPW